MALAILETGSLLLCGFRPVCVESGTWLWTSYPLFASSSDFLFLIFLPSLEAAHPSAAF